MNRRHFLGGTALAATLWSLAVPAVAKSSPPRRLLPVPLAKGDTVGLVSPSSAFEDSFSLQLAREAMEALGFVVKTGAHYGDRRGHLAGSDAGRAGDLNAMFADRSVKAIVCTRGGSGAARLLPLLDYAAIQRNPKVLLGYSDITALHCAIQARTGLVTFHGPIGSGSWNRFNVEQFQRVLLDRELVEYRNKLEQGDELVPRQNRIVTIRGGKARGQLVGGNLTVLTALAGSPYLPDFTGKILFLEDVGDKTLRATQHARFGDAGWSSPVARQAHNLKVAGSTPAPATKSNKQPNLTQPDRSAIRPGLIQGRDRSPDVVFSAHFRLDPTFPKWPAA